MQLPSLRKREAFETVNKSDEVEWVDDSPSNAMCRLLSSDSSARGKEVRNLNIQYDEYGNSFTSVKAEEIPDKASCNCSLALSRFNLFSFSFSFSFSFKEWIQQLWVC